MSVGIIELMKSSDLHPSLDDHSAGGIAGSIGDQIGLPVYPKSLTGKEGVLYFLAGKGATKRLGVLTQSAIKFDDFSGEISGMTSGPQEAFLKLCELSSNNAAVLRDRLPFLIPRTLGLKKSAGCGDRLGLATPGHVRAIRHSTMAPIFAQQSIRENARTGRSPQIVMDDALWGVLQEGWRAGFGADADHLKSTQDIDSCAAAGFTFYTIDPGDHVDNEANNASPEVLKNKLEKLPWEDLETTWADTRSLLGKPTDPGNARLGINEEDLMRAAAKYGRVVAHTVRMYRHLSVVMGERDFELEMSVDETETVTSPAEHIYIAHELRRLGVKWVSLAPRYVGTFEKGVDYIGDLGEFERSFATHLAISREFGPYKLSLHSGSDKFSIYPIASHLAGEMVHLKTAGTSYLEALRTISLVNPRLFRDILAFARERYPVDRASYHVSARAEMMPNIAGLDDERLNSLLDDFHAREILHVTFGSVLNHPDFREPFFETLRGNEEAYYGMVEAHFSRHFSPFGEIRKAGN